MAPRLKPLSRSPGEWGPRRRESFLTLLLYLVYILGMSVRLSILAMLDERPMYGLQLKNEFELRTGAIWPLNVGQVYTTLARLERDGLVTVHDQEVDGQKRFEVTGAGRDEVRSWFDTPVARAVPDRDELVIKLVLARRRPGVDLAAVVQTERKALLKVLQDYTRLKADSPTDADIGWLVLLDSLILQTEAQVRWLDVCESRFSRARELTPENSVVAPDRPRRAADRSEVHR
ncbi:helix-turn-helix transcriptional regulator [soil metagenome]